MKDVLLKSEMTVLFSSNVIQLSVDNKNTGSLKVVGKNEANENEFWVIDCRSAAERYTKTINQNPKYGVKKYSQNIFLMTEKGIKKYSKLIA